MSRGDFGGWRQPIFPILRCIVLHGDQVFVHAGGPAEWLRPDARDPILTEI
jgi:hypothetical protein